MFRIRLSLITFIFTLLCTGFLSAATVNVKSAPYNATGNGVTDDTAAIQACINAVAGTGGTVFIPDGTYMINPIAHSGFRGLLLGSNMSFQMSPGATLKAISVSSDNYSILNALGVSNVTISGGTLLGERATHTGTGGESGVGLNISVSSHIIVEGVTASECWGDGFYVTDGSTDITLRNCIGEHNRRQGLSVVSVDGLLVQRCTFKNTQGTAPECGIDLEPNAAQHINNVRITGCTITNNRGGGIQCGFNDAISNASITNTLIDFNTITWNGMGARATGDASDAVGILCAHALGATSLTNGIIISDNTISGNAMAGVCVEDGCRYVVVKNNAISWTLNSSTYMGGGVVLDDVDYCSVHDNSITNCVGSGVWFLGPSSNSHNTLTPNTFAGNGGANYPSPVY